MTKTYLDTNGIEYEIITKEINGIAHNVKVCTQPMNAWGYSEDQVVRPNVFAKGEVCIEDLLDATGDGGYVYDTDSIGYINYDGNGRSLLTFSDNFHPNRLY